MTEGNSKMLQYKKTEHKLELEKMEESQIKNNWGRAAETTEWNKDIYVYTVWLYMQMCKIKIYMRSDMIVNLSKQHGMSNIDHRALL